MTSEDSGLKVGPVLGAFLLFTNFISHGVDEFR